MRCTASDVGSFLHCRVTLASGRAKLLLHTITNQHCHCEPQKLGKCSWWPAARLLLAGFSKLHSSLLTHTKQPRCIKCTQLLLQLKAKFTILHSMFSQSHYSSLGFTLKSLVYAVASLSEFECLCFKRCCCSLFCSVILVSIVCIFFIRSECTHPLDMQILFFLSVFAHHRLLFLLVCWALQWFAAALLWPLL